MNPKIPKGFDFRAAIGQLVIISIPGDGWNGDVERLIAERKAGGFIFFRENIPGTLAALKKFTGRMKKEAVKHTGLIPFISVDEEGGRVSRLKTLIGEHPAPILLAQMGVNAVERNYAALARKVKGAGFNITWAPVLDINTNPKNPVIGDRAFSTKTEEVVACGRAALRALRKGGLFTQAKHYPGHGDTPVDSHLDLPSMDTPLAVMRGRELLPFKMAAREKADFFMTAHIHFTKVEKKLPATFSKKFLHTVARGGLGYKGLIVTDDLNMNAVKATYSMEERIRLAMNAGADMLLIRDSHENILGFLDIFERLAREGKIPLARIRESLARVKRIKRRMKKKGRG